MRLIEEEEEEVSEGEVSADSSGGTQELVWEVQVWVWAPGNLRPGVCLAWRGSHGSFAKPNHPHIPPDMD